MASGDLSMTGAMTRAGALACVLATMAILIPVALAERSSESSLRTMGQAGWDMPLLQPLASQRGHSCTQPDDGTLSAIVPVATDHGSFASGVVFDINRVLTAAHAVQGGQEFFVRVGEVFQLADLLMVDHVNDLAVLAVDTRTINPLIIAGFDPAEAQTVWAAGYPRAQAMMTSSGVLQATREGDLHSSATIDSGQSGGGLLGCNDGAWEMLGMLRGYGTYLQGDRYVKLPNHSVSVAAATINEFLSSQH
ncbi:trypsin-like peptidase domain-containing protein [Granulosicoccus sp. 3-233]|uniref:trypsin-like peptidase domain-containing protein n=1 Tax=Granulosicoccus sp. 3-233 TaxID=3417969 RepID=UPI003D336D39